MTPSEIDHLDPRKYRKIYHAIRAGITSGDIAPGTRIPSIADLTVAHGISRGTASRALRDLVSDGLITRYPGHGYFATAPTTPAREALAGAATR
jgi:DNA-binding GntR family transcriptional regulator